MCFLSAFLSPRLLAGTMNVSWHFVLLLQGCQLVFHIISAFVACRIVPSPSLSATPMRGLCCCFRLEAKTFTQLPATKTFRFTKNFSDLPRSRACSLSLASPPPSSCFSLSLSHTVFRSYRGVLDQCNHKK